MVSSTDPSPALMTWPTCGTATPARSAITPSSASCSTALTSEAAGLVSPTRRSPPRRPAPKPRRSAGSHRPDAGTAPTPGHGPAAMYPARRRPAVSRANPSWAVTPPFRAGQIAGLLDRRHRAGIAGARRMVRWGAHAFITFGICSGFGTSGRRVQPGKRRKPHRPAPQPTRNPRIRASLRLGRLFWLCREASECCYTGTPVGSKCGWLAGRAAACRIRAARRTGPRYLLATLRRSQKTSNKFLEIFGFL